MERFEIRIKFWYYKDHFIKLSRKIYNSYSYLVMYIFILLFIYSFITRQQLYRLIQAFSN